MNVEIMRSLRFLLFLALAVCVLVCTSGLETAGEKEPQWEIMLPGNIQFMDLSDDGDSFVVATEDDLVLLYITGSPQPLWNHSSTPAISCVSLSGDAEHLLVGTHSGTVQLLSSSHEDPVWITELPGEATDVELSRNGSIGVVTTVDTLFLFDTGSNKPLWNITLANPITALSLSPSGDSCVIGTGSGSLYLFERSSDQPVWNASTGNSVLSLGLSGDGGTVIAGSVDDHVWVFSGDNGTELWNYTTGNDVTTVDISSTGGHLAAGSDDGTILLFERNSSVPLWSYSTGAPVRSVDLSSDGSFISAGTQAHRVYHFRTDSDVPVWDQEYPDEIPVVLSTSDGFNLAVHTGSDTLHIYARVSAFFESIIPAIALDDDEIEFSCLGASDEGAIIRYVLMSSIDNVFYNGTMKKRDFTMSVGLHDISLRVMDEHGIWSGWITTSIVVSDEPNGRIENIKTVFRDGVYKVRLIANGSVDIGTITEYIWSSNIEGEFYRGPEAIIEFYGLSAGEHIISLRVVNSYGFTSQNDIKGFDMNDRPVAVIDFLSPAPAIIGQSVSFWGGGNDLGEITRYVWNSSIDGEFSNGTDSTIEYSSLSLGDHIISLKVLDDRGFWSEEVTDVITITTRPETTIDSITPDIIFKGSQVTFLGTTVNGGPIQRVVWHSSIDGELFNGTGFQFSISTLTAGDHDITLIVQDDLGIWSHTVNASLRVLHLPLIKTAYAGQGVVSIKVTLDVDSMISIRMNGNPAGENLTLARRHTLDVQINEGMNSYVLGFTTGDGKNVTTDPLPLELTKSTLHDSLSGSVSLDRGKYQALAIADLDEGGDIIGPLEPDVVLEITVEASGRIDVFLAVEDDLEEWKDIQEGRTAVFSYYREFSGMDVTTLTAVLSPRDNKTYYLILDNTGIPVAGAVPSGTVDITYSILRVESPDRGVDVAFDSDNIRMDFGESETGGGGGSSASTIIFILLIVIIVAAGVLLAGMFGYVDLSFLPLPDVFLGGSDDGWGTGGSSSDAGEVVDDDSDTGEDDAEHEDKESDEEDHDDDEPYDDEDNDEDEVSEDDGVDDGNV